MSAPVVLAEPVSLTTAERFAGTLALATARALLAASRGRPYRLSAILQAIQSGATHYGGFEYAESARAIIETVSLRCAGPHGCLLRSVAVLLLCRSRGYRATWCVGVHSPPPSSHAWIEVDGRPVGEPFRPRDHYTPIITA